MIGKTAYYTFEEVIKDTQPLESDDLMSWMQAICKYYLTEQDTIILDALRAKQEGKYKQRELSVLFCMSQPFLSVKFKHIRTKILTLYNFLQSDDLISQYNASPEDLTSRQFSLLRLIMAGNSFYDIARIEEVSLPDVSITFKLIVKRLSAADKYPILVKFLYKYKGKFIKN